MNMCENMCFTISCLLRCNYVYRQHTYGCMPQEIGEKNLGYNSQDNIYLHSDRMSMLLSVQQLILPVTLMGLSIFSPVLVLQAHVSVGNIFT